MPHRRPLGPFSARVRPVRGLRAVLVGGLTAAVLALTAAPAFAVPAAPPTPNPSDQQIDAAAQSQAAAAADVGRIAGLVADQETKLEQLEVQAEAAGAASDAAERALQEAQDREDRAAAALAGAQAAVADAQGRLADFSRNTYMGNGSLSRSAALLDASGPGDLVERAATLDWVAANQVDVLGQLLSAQTQQADAETAARTARDARAAAQRTAAAAKAQAEAQLAGGKASYDQVTAQKAALDQQLQDAQVHLLQLQGARDAYQQWLAQKQAAEAAALAAQRNAAQNAASAAAAARTRGGGVVLPAAGTTSSCFGSRWGEAHLGVDIAAPIGTPIYAATSGVIARSGPATGFGLAVYLQGSNGVTTVYGHVNRTFVQAGDRVTVGQQIAEVGNRGQSTGPHLHFEAHPDGELYSGAVNPAAWLRAQGIAFSGC